MPYDKANDIYFLINSEHWLQFLRATSYNKRFEKLFLLEKY